MTEKVDIDVHRRSAVAVTRMLEIVDLGTRKPVPNVVRIALQRKMNRPRVPALRAAE